LNINTNHISSLILIAGISGAGKSSVLHALADLGYYAIDNLPVAIFQTFLNYSAATPEKFKRTALLLDVYSLTDSNILISLLNDLKGKFQHLELFFVDCANEVIIKRYSETRRPHPAFEAKIDHSLNDTIIRERERLIRFKELATYAIDTSTLNIHELRRQIKLFVDNLGLAPSTSLRLNFISFGFKKGIPRDCDLIIDVRFLPNPYFIPELRKQTGLDANVREYIERQPATKIFITKYTDLLKFLIPQYVYEGKSYLNIGVGCTGGQHRSVAIAEILAKELRTEDYLISVQHREIQNK